MLHIASRLNAPASVVEALIGLGCDVECRNINGWTPLDEAVQMNSSAAATVLEAVQEVNFPVLVRTASFEARAASVGSNPRPMKRQVSDSSRLMSPFICDADWPNTSALVTKSTPVEAACSSVGVSVSVSGGSDGVSVSAGAGVAEERAGISICIGDIHGQFDKMMRLWYGFNYCARKTHEFPAVCPTDL